MRSAKSPYVHGSTFTLTRHLPPAPLGGHYPTQRTRHVNQFLQAHSQLEVCLMLPPIECPQPEAFKRDTIEFSIIRKISVNDGHGAQVVLGNANFPNSSPTTVQTLVAKIYDPLFYPGPGSNPFMIMAHGVDFTQTADRHYSVESAAYTELDPYLGGQEVLKYYGSWTCSVPVDEVRCRPVRLILLEHVPGLSMLDAEPQKYQQNQRYDILAQLLEADIKVMYHGVEHKDYSPRNTLIGTREDGTNRVVLLDFADSVVHRFARLPVLKDYIPCPNPPYNHRMDDYFEWIQLGWEELPVEWMERRWGNADFTPPPREYLDAKDKVELVQRNSYIDALPPPDSCPVDLIDRPPEFEDSIAVRHESPEKTTESWRSGLINAAWSYVPSISHGNFWKSRGHSLSDTASDGAGSSSDW